MVERPIRDNEDLLTYQRERRLKLCEEQPRLFDRLANEWMGTEGEGAWTRFFYYVEFLLKNTTPGKANQEQLRMRKPHDYPRFSWIVWWERNRHRFAFKTKEPVTIDVSRKFYRNHHITTSAANGRLNMDAVSATYRQMIERAAAELGVPVFIGEVSELRSMQMISTLRLCEFTFDEFAYLIRKTVRTRYRKKGETHFFGGSNKAAPRGLGYPYAIKMDRTVFSVGEKIPVMIVSREAEPMVNPTDPVFKTYGSFKVTDNAENVIRDFLPQEKRGPTMAPFTPPQKDTPFDLTLDNPEQLGPGEYVLRFKYLEHETPPLAFEIYEKGRLKLHTGDGAEVKSNTPPSTETPE